MSPYEVRYIDVKVINGTPLSGPVTIAIEEGIYLMGCWASSVLTLKWFYLYVNLFFNFVQIFNSGAYCV